MRRAAWLGVVAAATVGLPGCTGDCDPETVERAEAFIAAHQSCETDDDCVVVSDYCEELSGGFCGQLAMSRAGSESAEWRSLDEALSSCGPDECTVCAAALVPTCGGGTCN